MVSTSRVRPQGPIVRLVVTGVERQPQPDGTSSVTALHGTNGQRRWRLSLADALLAARTGRYVFEMEHAGERHRAELLGETGSERLYARTADHSNLLDALPDVLAPTAS
ncbi:MULTISPECIES: hypothetical protein [Ramlibacter]|uniref:DUF3892 domain-containing protein n=1 Tax=Ramlibacter pinisoli TaxID=2682844 RepID=A0A6N8J029_9BURK|nr:MULTISPECIES: hypothetical protein [Ramlibacter]MBA2962263.1 hypothetical protein [Ramlibacter sp. CGMCC 1.13660]MVQ32205.1 hypothetical protein [Ramlibacter pinisoli]